MLSSRSDSSSSLHKRMSVSTMAEARDADSTFIEVKKVPSEAFFKSMQIAQGERDRYPEDKEMLLPNQSKRIGWKTFVCAVFMSVSGIALFLSGLIIYCSSKKGAAHNGLEMLVTGAILLLPGCYACTIVYGYYKQWRGYDLEQLPSYD